MVEMLVALSILVILFTLLFLPMLTGMNLFHQGQARAEVQGTVRMAMEQMQRELALAMYVYPNNDYIESPGTVSVPSRIDFLLPQTNSAGQVMFPLQPQSDSSSNPLFVSYYVRLMRPSDSSDATDTNGDGIPDSLTATSGTIPNLHVLYRAAYTLPGTGGLDDWRTYSSTTSIPPYTAAGENPAFSLENNTKTSSTGRSHTTITPLQNTDVSALTFQLEGPTAPNPPFTGVSISLRVTRFDVAKSGGVSSELKQDIQMPNVPQQ